MLKRIKKHYHWIIAFLVFLEMIVYGGLINSASVFTLPVSSGLGVRTTAYSVAMMPYTVVCFLGTSFSGVLFARFGYKKTAQISLVLIALSLVLTASARNIVVFGISKVLFGMGYGACFTAGSVRIVKDWFWKHQGLVLGAVSMATGLGGSLMTVVLTAAIDSVGWRGANLVAAAIVAVIAVLYFLVKDRPDHMQLKPYGYGAPMTHKKKIRQTDDDWPGYPLKEQLRRPAFYLMCVAVLVSCVCLYTTSGFVIPHFVSIGLSGAQAATYQSTYMLTLAAAKLLVGFFYDRFGAKPVMLTCMVCAVASQAILGTYTDPVMSLVGIELFAVGLCMSSIMIPLLTTPLFGYKGSLAVNGIFLGLSSFASLFSSPLASMSYDRCGSYMPVYRVTALVNIGMTVLYIILFAIARAERRRHKAQQEAQ